MVSQIRIRAIELRLIAVGAIDGRFEVVGNADLREPSEGLKRAHVRPNPVGKT